MSPRLNRDLLALEKDPLGEERAERVRTLFRTAHSLKGAARSVSVGLIESACHRLEEILAAVRDGRQSLDAELFVVLFAAADAIEEAGMRLREQQDLSGTPLAALLPRLEAAALGTCTPPMPAVGPKQEKTTVPESRERAATPPPREQPTVDAPALEVAAPVGEPQPVPVSAPGTVRVAAEKLDMFLARNGELLVARRRIQSRGEELAALREQVGRWKADWKKVEKPLAEFLRANGGGKDAKEPDIRSDSSSIPSPAAFPKLPRRAGLALGRVGDNLRNLEKDLDHLSAAVTADGRILKEAAGAVDDAVRQVRMLPFAEACQGLDRTVRDLARSVGKEVELVIEGGDVELDRSVLEGLKDPLRHLVRNAVDHGAEPAAARLAAGKPRHTRLVVSAVLRGATVEVTVSVDGRGINLDALRQQARKRGLGEPLDDRELARLIFLPGLSTAPLITDVSGRGVGLDVVKSHVEALHGVVDLTFTSGGGTRFILSLPLTLTTLRVLLVTSAGQTFAFVGTTVQKLVRVDPSQLRTIEGREMLALGGTPVPVASLAETLGLRARETLRTGGKTPAVVVAVGDKRLALVVDDFLAEQEVVVKSLGARVRRLQHVSAATILPSGQIAPVLNTANVIRTALQREKRRRPQR